MAITWPRESLGLGEYGIEVDDARDWLARISATTLAIARAEAGWVARAADFELACALAERVADDVDSADLLFKRQYGLRAFPHEMARDSRIVPGWVRELRSAPTPLAFLVGLSRVVRPWLLAECRRYRARTAPNADGPTLRQIRLIEPELERLISWGAEEIARLAGPDPEGLVAATAWASGLERRMLEAGMFFGESARSDGDLWGTVDAQPDRPALRQLAAVVYEGSDLPWDALLGLAKHLGDFGRHARRGELSLSVGDLPLPSDASSLDERLGRLASLLDDHARRAEQESGHESARYFAASARAASNHAAEWARRLSGAGTPVGAAKSASEPKG